MNNPPSNIIEQIDVVKVLWALVGFFSLRTLNKIDKNQGLLFQKHEALEKEHTTLAKEFSEMKGEHKVLTKDGAHCGVKK